MRDKNNFWNNTRGVFSITGEGDFNDLITIALNQHSCKEFECNFNKLGDAFFIRTDEYAIRISNKWYNVGSCEWILNRDADTEKYQMVTIRYDELKDFIG